MSNAAHDPLMNLSLRKVDPELDAIFVKEAVRQRDHIELIASENYTYAAVREAQGSILTNKYAEGLPGSATTPAVNLLTKPRTLHETARYNSLLAASMSTYSRTQARRQTLRPSLPLCHRATHSLP